MDKKFTKDDLKSGDIVTTRDGATYMLVNSLFINNKGFMRLPDYKDDLVFKDSSGYMRVFDIIKVQRPQADIYFCKNYWESAEVIWEREETVEMTLEEVCKALGKNVKIVKE